MALPDPTPDYPASYIVGQIGGGSDAFQMCASFDDFTSAQQYIADQRAMYGDRPYYIIEARLAAP